MKTLAEIAAARGWTYKAPGNHAGDYVFMKGGLSVTFNRRGWGTLNVRWCGRRVPWDTRLSVGDERVTLSSATREQYADAVLSQVNEPEAIRRVETAMNERIENLKASLRAAELDREAFVVEKTRAQEAAAS
jgi:hypothetical protein